MTIGSTLDTRGGWVAEFRDISFQNGPNETSLSRRVITAGARGPKSVIGHGLRFNSKFDLVLGRLLSETLRNPEDSRAEPNPRDWEQCIRTDEVQTVSVAGTAAFGAA